MNKHPVDLNHNCFDLIRIICTFTVFFGHFLKHFGVDNAFLHGVAYFVRGVPVFFFLSGLFIARSLERYDTREFLIRRAIRIFPELWICVLLNLALIFISGIRGSIKDIAIYLGTQLSFFQFFTGNWLRGYGVGTPNGALWTITVDIQFYVAAILLARWLKQKSLKQWGLLIVIMMLVPLLFEKLRAHFPELVYKLLECNLLSFLWIFLAGMCVYYHGDKLVVPLVKLRWMIAAIYITWQYAVPESVQFLFSGIRYNLITTALLLLMVCSLGFSAKLRFRQDFSYSFYLYHMVVINFVIHNLCSSFTSNTQFVCWQAACTVIIGALAFLSHVFVGGRFARALERKIRI